MDERAQVSDLLRRYANGGVGSYEFDDFISTRQADQELEYVRRELISLPERFPPGHEGQYCNQEGRTIIMELADNLAKK